MNILNTMLLEIDNSQEKISEPDVYEKLDKINRDDLSNEEIVNLNFELIAFGFCENYSWSDEGWGTYFGPELVIPNDDGTTYVFPHRNQITKETIDYWQLRLDKSNHPLLKARYAGLIWDFCEYIQGKKPSIEIVRTVIDSCNEIVIKRQHKYEFKEILNLKRALNLALSINDKQRIEILKNTILDYEKNIIKNDAAVEAWSISYEMLLVNKTIKLTEKEHAEIIDRIEGRLNRLVNFYHSRQWIDAVKDTSVLLAKYYTSKNENEKSKAILSKYIDAVYKQIELENPLKSYPVLNEAYQIKDFNLKKEADEIALKLQEINSRLDQSLHPISVTVEVEQEEIRNFIDRMTEGDVETCLNRLTFYYFLNKSEVEQQVKKLSETNSFSYSFPRTITDHKGRPVANIGEIQKDLEGHTIFQAAQNIHFNKGLGIMRAIIKKIICQHEISVEFLISYLYKSPVFSQEKREIFKLGLQAYLNDDSITAMHLLIPQIEDAIRSILYISGQPVIKQNQDGGYNLKVLDKLLCDQIVLSILGENIVFYFRVLFTDPRGLCLRHNVCHGLAANQELTMENADLIFHTLLILSEIKIK